MRRISFPAQENPERRVFARNNGARLRVVADALTTCEPGFGRRGLAAGRRCRQLFQRDQTYRFSFI